MFKKVPVLPPLHSCTVAVIGLGYVGLPLAVEFAKSKKCARTGVLLHRRVLGFDINVARLEELRAGYDRTRETSPSELRDAVSLEFTSDSAQLDQADVFVVTVPTPIDSAKRPNLINLEHASATVGQALKALVSAEPTNLPVVIFESTVYPGATEEICVPILEHHSSLAYNCGFVCGYSPERINPGDQEHRLSKVTKVTSGSTPDAAQWVDDFYGSIIQAGTHLAPSIKVAEAAKVIENTQRDLNIALVNELAIIFRQMDIDTRDILEAASTKWNFLPFQPGLVGGHCIGVDPYYLTHKAEQLGYHPQVVLAGRRINDGMGRWVVDQLVLELARRGTVIARTKVLVLGFSFKENCPDLRNTRVIDVINSLKRYAMEPQVVDPCVDCDEAYEEYGVKVIPNTPFGEKYEAVVVAVAHNQFRLFDYEQWSMLLATGGVIVDIKGIVPRRLGALRL